MASRLCSHSHSSLAFSLIEKSTPVTLLSCTTQTPQPQDVAHLSLSSLKLSMLSGLYLSAMIFFFFSLSVCFFPRFASAWRRDRQSWRPNIETNVRLEIWPPPKKKLSVIPSGGRCCNQNPCCSERSSSWLHPQPYGGRRPPPSSCAQPKILKKEKNWNQSRFCVQAWHFITGLICLCQSFEY